MIYFKIIKMIVYLSHIKRNEIHRTCSLGFETFEIVFEMDYECY